MITESIRVHGGKTLDFCDREMPRAQGLEERDGYVAKAQPLSAMASHHELFDGYFVLDGRVGSRRNDLAIQ